MNKNMIYKRMIFHLIIIAFTLPSLHFSAEMGMQQQEKIVQAEVVLTVAQSKRLIAKAVAQMPIVQRAKKDGMLIIAKGTTNTYVAEEITGKPIEKGAYVWGIVYPKNSDSKLQPEKRIPELIWRNGKIAPDLSLKEAVKLLKPTDVVIKGANALDYQNKIAAVLTGGGSGGTTGTIWPYVVARKAQLVIPVGLEKLVAGDVVELTNKMREPVKSLNKVRSMFLLTGLVVTEIEAYTILTNVTAFQAAAGGIGGAEGAVRLVLRGSEKNVKNALDLTTIIQKEPPFAN
jgi:hypothetical protein